MRPSPPARHFPHEPIVETRTFPPLREQFALLQNDSAQAAKKNCRLRLVQDPRDASLSPRTGRDGRQQVANSRQPPNIHLWDIGNQKHLQPFAFPPRWGDVNQGVSVSLRPVFSPYADGSHYCTDVHLFSSLLFSSLLSSSLLKHTYIHTYIHLWMCWRWLMQDGCQRPPESIGLLLRLLVVNTF